MPPVSPVLDVQRNSKGTLIVIWKELTPDKALGIITNYTVTYQRVIEGRAVKTNNSADFGFKVVNGTTTSVSFANLDDKSSYNFSSWANTSVGRGKRSPPILVKRKKQLKYMTYALFTNLKPFLYCSCTAIVYKPAWRSLKPTNFSAVMLSLCLHESLM